MDALFWIGFKSSFCHLNDRAHQRPMSEHAYLYWKSFNRRQDESLSECAGRPYEHNLTINSSQQLIRRALGGQAVNAWLMTMGKLKCAASPPACASNSKPSTWRRSASYCNSLENIECYVGLPQVGTDVFMSFSWVFSVVGNFPGCQAGDYSVYPPKSVQRVVIAKRYKIYSCFCVQPAEVSIWASPIYRGLMHGFSIQMQCRVEIDSE